MHAIILAGGFGTRLKSAVADVPKPLAPIAGKPFLAWLIASLVKNGVSGITLSLHHEAQKIRDYFEEHPAPVPIAYAVEKTPLGTGGAMAFAMRDIREPAIILNGDTFVEVDYRALYAAHRDALTMVLREVADTGRYGEVIVENDIIQSFAPGRAGQKGLINAGIYVVSPDLFAPFAMPEAFSFERDFLPPRLPALKPRAWLAPGYFIDIGIPEDYARACRELPRIA